MDFIYLIRPVRQEMINNMTPEEEQVLDMHFAYLKDALENDKLVLAGPCLDGSFGIVIFHGDSEEEAAGFMESDPAVKGGLMTAEIHPFRISLK